MHRSLFCLFLCLGFIQVGYAEPIESSMQELEKQMDAYLRLYEQNQEVFTVYHGKAVTNVRDKSLMLYRHICQSVEFKPICKPAKEEIMAYFEARLTKQADKKTDYDYDTLQPIVEELRRKMAILKAEFHRRMSEELIQNRELHPTIKTRRDFNQVIRTIYQSDAIQAHFSAYEKNYLHHADGIFGIALLSKKLKGIIEGETFSIERDDFLLGVDEIAQKIRTEFQRIVREDPRVLQKIQLPYGHKEKEWAREEWKAQGFHALKIPEVSEEQFKLIQQIQSYDSKTLQLLIDGLYLKAFWRLRSMGFMKQASIVEKWITDTACADTQVQSIGTLGGGVTVTKLVKYPFGIKGVYKPVVKPGDPYRGLIQWLGDKVARYRHEVAAYRIDWLLNLNYVPITKEVHLADGVGSLQYFVEPATQARFMNHSHNPKTSSRWAKHRGRALEDGNIRLLDWIISNADRNVDNYLLQDDGQVILIDHSFSFFYKTPNTPTAAGFEKMIPSRRVYYALLYCTDHPEVIEKELFHWVSKWDLHLVKARIQYATRTLQKLIQKKGEDVVFAKSDAVDRQMGVERPDLKNFSRLAVLRSYLIESDSQMVAAGLSATKEVGK